MALGVTLAGCGDDDGEGPLEDARDEAVEADDGKADDARVEGDAQVPGGDGGPDGPDAGPADDSDADDTGTEDTADDGTADDTNEIDEIDDVGDDPSDDAPASDGDATDADTPDGNTDDPGSMVTDAGIDADDADATPDWDGGAGCGVQIWLDIGTSALGSSIIRPFWRDAAGLHLVSSVVGGTERILFDTYDPVTGERVRRTRYAALDVDASRVADGVAHSPGGVVAISFGIREIGYEGDFLLLTSVDDPDSFDVVRMPLDDFESVATRGLAWDGEAFVWHGLVNSEGERTLTVARFAPDGEVVLPPTIVGPPSTSIWNNYDLVTDPASGTSWMVAPARDAVRVTGTKRDGTPLVPIGQSLPLLGSIDSNGSANDEHVASGPAGEALRTFTVSLDGLFAQRVNSGLEELGGPAQVPVEWIDGRFFDFSENASAYAQETWWLFATTGLGVDGFRLGQDSVAERFEFIHYPAREIYAATGDYPTLMLMDSMSTYVWQDEIWLGVLDESTAVLGGAAAPYRVLLVEPGCVYPSFYDLTQ